MPIRVAINGFGRIGRLYFRAAWEMGEPYIKDIDFVAINDIGSIEMMAHLLRYDSVHGKFPFKVETEKDAIIIEGKRIRFITQPDPAKLPWKDLDVYLAAECTGRFTDRESASKHLHAGAKKVLISAPAKGPDITIVLGCNEHQYDPQKHIVLSNASCTTNCVVPVTKVLHDAFNVKALMMTTAHAVTNDQRILDLVHPDDFRRARAGAWNIVPTTTGAARATALVIPELKGKADGIALRVPIPNVSICDITALVEKAPTKEEVNEVFRKAAEGPLKGIIAYTDDPIVSSDLNHTPWSAVVDGQSTMVIGNLVKVLAWYDNEWAFSIRMVELTQYIARKDGLI